MRLWHVRHRENWWHEYIVIAISEDAAITLALEPWHKRDNFRAYEVALDPPRVVLAVKR